jgi:hypothetical protein
MNPRRLAPLAVALTALALSGCVQRIMDFTVISTKNVDIPGTRGEKVTGEDMKSIVIIIPTGTPNVKAAVDDALNKGGGDVLVDGVISFKNWYIPYIYGQMGFIVEGTSMKTFAPGTAPAERPIPAAPAVAERAVKKKAAPPAAPVDAPEAAEPAAPAAPSAPEAAEAAVPSGTPAEASSGLDASASYAADAPPAAEPAAHGARLSASEVASELLP